MSRINIFGETDDDDKPSDQNKKEKESKIDSLFSDSIKKSTAIKPTDLFGDANNEKTAKSIDDLFGGTNESDNASDSFLPEIDNSVHFCRDCKHYLFHPYKSRCCLKEIDVEPMDDCPSFSMRTKDDVKKL